jgi:hypothetical protein
MTKSIHRDCGATVSEDASECWYCHQSLNAGNVITIERSQHVTISAKQSFTPTQHIDPADDDTSDSGSSSYSYRSSSWDFGDIYYTGRTITGIITFIVSYIYCIASYGFLFGLGLGWIPSLIVAFIAGFLWPLIAIVLVIFILIIIATLNK